MVSLLSLCSNKDRLPTQGPERAAQNVPFSLGPLMLTFSDSALITGWKYKLGNRACLDSCNAGPAEPSNPTGHCAPFAPGSPPTKPSPHSRPLHKPFPLPGADPCWVRSRTPGHSSRKTPLPAPQPKPQPQISLSLHSWHLYNGFRSSCDDFFVSPVSQSALELRNHVWFLLTTTFQDCGRLRGVL